MQRGKERSGFDLEGSAGDLLDALRDANAMTRLEFERPQYQKVQSALEEFGP
jgi:hypothetical protein